MKPLLPVVLCLIAPDIILALLIAIRPSRGLRLFASLLLVYVSYYTVATYTTGDIGGDYGLGSALGATPFSVLLLLWLSDPMKEYKYVQEPTPLETMPLITRFYYALCILRNPRFIGLNVQLPHVPPPFKGTRSRFVFSRIIRILECLLLIDLGQSFIHTRPEFFLQGTSSFPGGLQGHILRFACSVSWILCGYATLRLMNTIISLVCVSTGSALLAGDPKLWPEMFGSWKDAYSVRRTWGRVWHQNLRRCFSFLGKPIAHSSGARKGSFLSSQIQLWVAFSTAGIIHCFGDLMVASQYTGKSMPFFLMNAAAVTFEDLVLAVAKRMGMPRESRMARVVGYVWVLSWFHYSLPVLYTWTIDAGLGRDEMLPLSLVRRILPSLSNRA